MVKVPYACVVCCFMYAMIATCPDIAFVVGVVSRYMATPCKKHWEGVKCVMRYLKGTKGLCIFFGGKFASVIGYRDADYVGNVDNKRSTSCYVFTFTDDDAISWISRL